MQVRELIALLQQMPADAEVVVARAADDQCLVDFNVHALAYRDDAQQWIRQTGYGRFVIEADARCSGDTQAVVLVAQYKRIG